MSAGAAREILIFALFSASTATGQFFQLWLSRDAFRAPLRGAEQRRLGRKKGEHCLRGFSPELRSPRPRRVAQGTGAAGTDPGSPSSLLAFFLATQEESKTRVRRGTRR